jgi:hypothetical protein
MLVSRQLTRNSPPSRTRLLASLKFAFSLRYCSFCRQHNYRDSTNIISKFTRKGQADIIVAKHRNGPTGEVILAFDQARSRFHDLDVAITPDGEIAFAKEDNELTDDGAPRAMDEYPEDNIMP